MVDGEPKVVCVELEGIEGVMGADAVLIDDGRGWALQHLVGLGVLRATEPEGLVPLEPLAEHGQLGDRGSDALGCPRRTRALRPRRMADKYVAPTGERHNTRSRQALNVRPRFSKAISVGVS